MAVKTAKRDCLDTVKSVRDALDVINGKWKLSIFISLSIGNERFTDIQDSIPGITPKILANELKELEQHKLIKRITLDDYPVKIVYRLELYAHTLIPIITALKDWGINHRKKIFGKGYIEPIQTEVAACLTEEGI